MGRKHGVKPLQIDLPEATLVVGVDQSNARGQIIERESQLFHDRHLLQKRHLLTIVSWVLVPEKHPTLFWKSILARAEWPVQPFSPK